MEGLPFFWIEMEEWIGVERVGAEESRGGAGKRLTSENYDLEVK